MTRAPNELSRAASSTPSLRWLRLFYPPASDAEIGKARFFRVVAVIDVPEVHKDPASKRASDLLEVERTEFVPLGHDDQCVGPGSRGIGVVGEFDSFEHAFRLFTSDRI